MFTNYLQKGENIIYTENGLDRFYTLCYNARKVVIQVIVYKDILKKLSDAGWSTYRLQMEREIPNSAIIRIRKNESITMATLDTICRLTGLKPGDLLDYVEDEQGR